MGRVQVVLGETFCTSKWRLGVPRNGWNKRHRSERGERGDRDMGGTKPQSLLPGLCTRVPVHFHRWLCGFPWLHPISDSHQCDHEWAVTKTERSVMEWSLAFFSQPPMQNTPQSERKWAISIGQPYSLEPCYSNSCPRTPSRSTTWEPVEMQMLRPQSRTAASVYAFK